MTTSWNAFRQGAVHRLTLHGTSDLNLLTTENLRELEGILEALSQDTSLKLLILAGNGTRAFCAGADLHRLAILSQEEAEAFVAAGEKALERLATFPVLTLAALNGPALGAGFELAMCCDLRYGSELARLGQPAVRHGLVPPFGSAGRLIHLIGGAKARDLFFTGRTLSAAEARQWGLISGILPQEGFEGSIASRAQEIAQVPRQSLVLSKAVIQQAIAKDEISQALEREALLQTLLHPETQDQVRRFLDS